jgi:hypothetical protein
MPGKVPSRTFQGDTVHADETFAISKSPTADHQSGRMMAREAAPPGILHPADYRGEGRVDLDQIDAFTRTARGDHLTEGCIGQTGQAPRVALTEGLECGLLSHEVEALDRHAEMLRPRSPSW